MRIFSLMKRLPAICFISLSVMTGMNLKALRAWQKSAKGHMPPKPQNVQTPAHATAHGQSGFPPTADQAINIVITAFAQVHKPAMLFLAAQRFLFLTTQPVQKHAHRLMLPAIRQAQSAARSGHAIQVIKNRVQVVSKKRAVITALIYTIRAQTKSAIRKPALQQQ